MSRKLHKNAFSIDYGCKRRAWRSKRWILSRKNVLTQLRKVATAYAPERAFPSPAQKIIIIIIITAKK
jgi:phage gp46-like protein